jgi:hypothetical protein
MHAFCSKSYYTHKTFFVTEGKPVPTELQNTGANLKADLPFDEAQAGKHS